LHGVKPANRGNGSCWRGCLNLAHVETVPANRNTDRNGCDPEAQTDGSWLAKYECFNLNDVTEYIRTYAYNDRRDQAGQRWTRMNW
jgi:hypothetical protein